MATFVLVPRGTDVPVSVIPTRSTVIEIPVRRAILRSASHASFFSLLGLTDRIVGIVQGKYVNDPEVAGLVRNGKITEVGVGSGMTAQFDVERLFSLRPDLVLSNWTNNPAYAAHIKAQEAGLPVALISDYEENTPLGRAEWIKFIAAFFNAEAEAERIFDDIERRYLAMAAKARNVNDRPTVMYGTSYQGSWFIAGGKSCFANLVKDAGGRYVWTDNDGIGSRPVDAETAMIRGRNADCWFTHNQSHFSLASMAAEDSRYTLFRSFRAGRVYGNNGKIGPGGGNDYYQGTATRPDLLLADMIAIIHPELLPDHELIWHVHLPPTLSGGTGADGVQRK
jgi:iron complex transport system substrate-binding protein